MLEPSAWPFWIVAASSGCKYAHRLRVPWSSLHFKSYSLASPSLFQPLLNAQAHPALSSSIPPPRHEDKLYREPCQISELKNIGVVVGDEWNEAILNTPLYGCHQLIHSFCLIYPNISFLVCIISLLARIEQFFTVIVSRLKSLIVLFLFSFKLCL